MRWVFRNYCTKCCYVPTKNLAKFGENFLTRMEPRNIIKSQLQDIFRQKYELYEYPFSTIDFVCRLSNVEHELMIKDMKLDFTALLDEMSSRLEYLERAGTSSQRS